MSDIKDAQERKDAIDPTRSFIVQAPAGSGKTGLLIQRYLRLLGRVDVPEQILAMTFTRKAAGEMKARILDALEHAQEATPPEAPHENLTWQLAREALKQDERQNWSLLKNPARLKIQTIDSFCSSLVRQMPLLSRTGGPLDIQEKPGEFYRETAWRIQQRIETDTPEGEAIRTVFRHLDNSKSGFRDRIVELLQKRDQWMSFFFQNFEITENSRKSLEEVLTGVIENVLAETRSLFTNEAARELVQLAAYCGENRSLENPEDPLASLRGISQFPEITVSQLNPWRALAKLLLTQSGGFRKRTDISIGFLQGPAKSPAGKMKIRFKDLVETLTKDPLLLDMLLEVQKLPDPSFSDDEWIVLKATLDLLPRMAETLRQVFADRGKTDFTEVSLSAIDSLGEEQKPTDLLLYLDIRIQHILVDEFQDTSYKQLRLLKLLTAGWERGDGRTLFIVGDPIQSIYRFRDAEVGLFLRTQEKGITDDVKLKILKLKTNFRSQKKVVDWVNACFGEIFPQRDDPDLGAIAYAKSEAVLKEEVYSGAVLHPLNPENDKDARSNEEAQRMVKLIKDIQSTNPKQTIAILVRARSHLAAAVRRFHDAGIVFNAEEIDPLTSRPAIQDLLALLRALLSPTDRAAWLSILRAPWCGLSLTDLQRLCELESSATVWQLLNDPDRLTLLSPDGRLRAQRFIDFLRPALKSLPSADLRDLLEGIWIRFGGPACIDAQTMPDVEVFFDEVANTLNKGDAPNLQQFDLVLENLYSNHAPNVDNPVQIMTMHKAKGLEFDHVLLPGLGNRPPARKKRLVFWIPRGDDLLIAPIEEKGEPGSRIYDFLARLDERKNDFESLRLLYVAATRARKQIHLFGHVKEEKDSDFPSWKPEKHTLLAKLWPHIGAQWNLNLMRSEEITNQDTKDTQDSAAHRTQRLPHPADFPEPHPAIKVGAVTELAQDTGESLQFVWKGNRERCLGIVLHLFFQTCTERGDDPERHMQDLTNNTNKIRTALLGEGISPHQVEEAVKDGMRALKNTLQDITGRWILTSHKEARSEYPLTGYIKGRFVSFKIDRTFVDENETRWIIDFKTGSHDNPEQHKPQLDQYEQLIRLHGETRPIKKALYFPMQTKLIELT